MFFDLRMHAYVRFVKGGVIDKRVTVSRADGVTLHTA